MNNYHVVELVADAINNIDPISGGQFAYQVRVSLDMSLKQRREAIANMLNAMSEQEAYEWLRSEFPDWFGVEA